VTIAAWPSTLPQCPILNGWDEQPQPAVAAFVPEVGPQKSKRRTTAKVWSCNAVYRMTNSDVITFNSFFETTLEDGSLPFSWPHPITKVSYNWYFDSATPPKFSRTTPKTQTVQLKIMRLP
jgi:hypothetical protein